MTTNQTTPQAKRKFKVEIFRALAFDIATLAQSQLPDGCGMDDPLPRSFFENNCNFCVSHGFEEPRPDDDVDEEWTDESGVLCGIDWHTFHIKVYDEDDNMVFSSDKYSDFRFVYDDVTKNDYNALATMIDMDVAQHLIFAKKCEDLEKVIGRGECLADNAYSQLFIMSANEYEKVAREFYVEDVEFDPRKLVFVENAALKGIGPNVKYAVSDFEPAGRPQFVSDFALLLCKVSKRLYHTAGVNNPTQNAVQCGVWRTTPTKCVGDTPRLIMPNSCPFFFGVA